MNMNYLKNLLQRTYPIVYGLLRMTMAAMLVIAGMQAEATALQNKNASDVDNALGKLTLNTAKLRAAAYTFTNVEIPGALFTRLFGINDRGDLVGVYRMPGSTVKGFLLRNTGGLVTIEVPGAALTFARDVSNTGVIVGSYTDQNGLNHGFVYQNGMYQQLDAPGSIDTLAFSITESGRVGGAWIDADGFQHGFTLEDNVYTTIDCPGPAPTMVLGMAANGTIAGDCAPDGVSAYLLTGGAFELVGVPGALQTSFFGVNSLKEAVGAYFDADGVEHGLVYRNGELLTVDEPSATFSTRIWRVNASGVIVGVVDRNRAFVAVPVK
jgi:probable HAF family extracellular repeat protein